MSNKVTNIKEILNNKINITEIKRDDSKNIVDYKYIKELRAKLDFTQQNFATTIGVSLNTVKSWEQNKTSPNLPTKKLIYLLNTNLELINNLYQVNRYSSNKQTNETNN